MNNAQSLKPSLTPRQSEATYWASQGKTCWEMAVIMGCSELTAKRHLQHARLKLNANNTTHLVSKCWELGIIRATCLLCLAFGVLLTSSTPVQTDDNTQYRYQRSRGGRRPTWRSKGLFNQPGVELDEDTGQLLITGSQPACIDLEDHPYLQGYCPARLALPAPDWYQKEITLAKYLDRLQSAIGMQSEIITRGRNQLLLQLLDTAALSNRIH